jgi:hypothetical protein
MQSFRSLNLGYGDVKRMRYSKWYHIELLHITFAVHSGKCPQMQGCLHSCDSVQQQLRFDGEAAKQRVRFRLLREMRVRQLT